MNKQRKILCRLFSLVLMIFIASEIGFAGEKERQYLIDEWLEKCIASDYSTACMTNCSIEATVMWDKEMNKVYKELIRKLPEKQKILLKKSQVQWLKFRDTENSFINEFYESFDGTMWQNVLASEKLNIVKERTLNLQGYLNSLKEK